MMNLIIKRVLNNELIVKGLKIERDDVLADFEAQRSLFFRIFPDQVEQGSRKPSTFDWMLSRCADGTGKTAPREVIHLLTSLQEKEIVRLERGEQPSSDSYLFDRTVFKEALPAVSEARLVQNVYAEHPELEQFLKVLSGEKTEQTVESLSQIWNLPMSETQELVQRLVDIGFFQPRGSREKPTYWVPFLFRDALSMSQGFAEETRDR